MRRGLLALVAATLAVAGAVLPTQSALGQASYQRISGEGSSWAAGAIDQMRVNVKQFGIVVDYNPSGSSSGRANFLNGTVDFAASDIPFQFHPEDGSAPENPKPGSYAYMPITAGGTAFMYNLKINGQRVVNLRLSGENVVKIFTGIITKWNDPALKADNPGLNLPDRPVVPIVRSDGSGSTAQFTKWVINQHGGLWNDYCKRSGRAPACGFTSFYPTLKGSGMIGQRGDDGVAGYIAQSFAEGAIGYVNYSYAISAQFPVVKVLNAAGYYTEPTPENVAVSLLQAQINTDSNSADYLTQNLDKVYSDSDKRNYQLSSYSYLILPTKLPEQGKGQFNADKGRTLGAFSYYAMCQAQKQSASIGYSPMPINLVRASFDQIKKIPGVVVQDIDIAKCDNPTFSPDGTNVLAKNAPIPPDCDKQGPSQCTTGTAGAKSFSTPVSGAGQGGGGAGGGDSGGGQGTTDGTSGTGAGADTGTGGSIDPTASGGADGGASTDGSTAGCDADTGACQTAASGGAAAGSGNSSSAASRAGGGAQAVASPTVLAGSSPWSSDKLLVAFLLILTLALVFVPALAWRYFGELS